MSFPVLTVRIGLWYRKKGFTSCHVLMYQKAIPCSGFVALLFERVDNVHASGTSPASAGNSHHPLLLCHKGLAASLPQQHHLHKCFKPASHPVSSSSPPSSFRLISNFPYVFSHHTASLRPSLKPPPKHSFAPLSLSSRFTSVRFYSSYIDNIITLSRHPARWKQAFFWVTPLSLTFLHTSL